MNNVATTTHNRWVFLGVISLGLFLIAADNSILYSALPTLREQLHTTELEGLWVINAYPLVLAGLLLGTGTLGDRIGHRFMFEAGLAMFGLASLVAAFAPNPEVLIAARAFLGMGASAMMPATLALIRITFTDPRERNTAIGIWGSVATVGSAAGPVLGGLLLEHFWWGSVFLINLPVVLVALVATHLLAPANVTNPDKHWDPISSIIATVAMGGVVLAIKELTHSPINPVLLAAYVAAFVLGAAGFAHRQRRLTQPLVTADIFANRLFVAGVVGAMLSMFILAGTELLTTQRFQLAEGLSPLEAGLINGAIAMAAFPTSIWGGANLHRLGFRPIISGGFLVIAAGLATSLLALGTGAGFGWFMTGAMGLGLGIGLVMSVTSTAIIGSAPRHRAGMASALEEVSYELGTVLSIAILGSLMSMFIHGPLDTATPKAIDFAYVATMCVALAVSVVAMVVTFILLKGNPKETEYAHE